MLLINIPNVVRNSLDIFLILPVPILQMEKPKDHRSSGLYPAGTALCQLLSPFLDQCKAPGLANFVQLISGSILSLVPAIWKCALH